MKINKIQTFLSVSKFTASAFLFLFCKISFAATSLCSKGLSGQLPLATRAQGAQEETSGLSKNGAIFLNLLEVVLEEIGKTEFGLEEIQFQLLERIANSKNPIDLILLVPDNHNHLFSLLRSKNLGEKLKTAISIEDWELIQKIVKDKIDRLQRTKEQHAQRSADSEADFLDSPDAKGRVRLHYLMETHQYDQARALIKNPRTSTRYINTRDLDGKTPWDMYDDHFEDQTINFRAPEDAVFPDRSLGVVLSKRGAMVGQKLRIMDQNFLNHGEILFTWEKPNPNLNRDEIAERAAQNLFLFFEKGGDLNAVSESEKNLATMFIEAGNLDGLKRLRSLGADFRFGKSRGQTLLHSAVKFANWQAVHFLFENGADINAPDKEGKSPLFYLKPSNLKIGLNLLLNLGANIDFADKQGWTIAHYHSFENRPEVLRVLSENGANLDLPNKAGYGPLRYCHEDDQEALNLFAEYFISKGIDLNSVGLYRSEFNPSTFYKKQFPEEP